MKHCSLLDDPKSRRESSSLSLSAEETNPKSFGFYVWWWYNNPGQVFWRGVETTAAALPTPRQKRITPPNVNYFKNSSLFFFSFLILFFQEKMKKKKSQF
jgi:hypothetical protein